MRVVTRGDFDGLVSTVLLSIVHQINDIVLAYPKDIEDKKIAITDNDIIANLPFDERCDLWFDHHINEVDLAAHIDYKGCFKVSPSCARVIYEYYKNEHLQPFHKLIEIADKIDTADLKIEDLKNPHGWFIVERTLHAYDPLGNLGDFTEYFKKLVQWIKEKPLSEILLSDEVLRRIEHVRNEHVAFMRALKECSRTEENVIISDSRSYDYFPNGNRFLIYTIFPEQNVSVSIFNRRKTDYSVIACGHNIFNRSCSVNIGEMLKKYGGSGRFGAGSVRVSKKEADQLLNEIVAQLKENS